MRDDDIVERLHKVVKHDWEHSHRLDLSDEGLLADLEERSVDAAEMLVLDEGKDHPKKHGKGHGKKH